MTSVMLITISNTSRHDIVHVYGILKKALWHRNAHTYYIGHV